MAYVNYDGTKPIGKMLAEVVRDFRGLKAKISRIKGVFDQITDGGVNKAKLETGDPNGNATIAVPVTFGDEVYDALVSLKAGIDTPTEATLSSIDLGG